MQRDYLISNIRIIATFIVVVGHSIMLYSNWELIPVSHFTPPHLLIYAKHIINLVQMTLFFSLSGYLHQHLINKGRSLSLKSLLTKKFLRLFIPYIFVSLIMITVKLHVNYCNWQELTEFEIVKKLLLMENDSHLWFLPALFQVFVLHFLLSRIEHKNIELGIALLISICSIYIPLNYMLHSGDALKYLFWFYLGCWVKSNEIRIEAFYKKYKFVVILVFILSVIISFLPGLGRTKSLIIQYISSISFITIMYSSTTKSKISNITEVLDRNSFAIYLFHIPVVYLIFYYNNYINPYIISTLCIVASYIVSITIGEIIRRSKLRILIGE